MKPITPKGYYRVILSVIYSILPFEFMIGIYTKFFDEKGLEGFIEKAGFGLENDFFILINNEYISPEHASRPEAQTELIKQLNIQYNERSV